MRLDKYLADTRSDLTRTAARDILAQGRVQVNGIIVRQPGFSLPANASVTLDGREITPQGPVYLMMHKPAGLITAREDAYSKTVFSILPQEFMVKDLCAVGRLDRDTTGLLLFTTNGQLAHRLISPRFIVEKTYVARVDGILKPEHILRMQEGIVLSDFTSRPAKLEIVAQDLGRLTVTEGKYHQVKRMFGALGCPVLSLHRERIGPVILDPSLSPGQVRSLTPEEVTSLLTLTGMTP